MINGICEWKCFNYCENGGACYIALKEPYCDCNNTGYHGMFNSVTRRFFSGPPRRGPKTNLTIGSIEPQ